MVQELLSRVLNSNRHIALLLLFVLSGSSVFSQSVLLPADVVVVSVNSSGDSFDFIPLVPLQEGTSIWFSTGKWDSQSTQISGDEIEVFIKSEIEAGTNIHVNEIEDQRVRVNGHLKFSGKGDRLFAYQKDEGVTRVIYGIGWGNADVWNAGSEIGSEIPPSISKSNNALIQLGLQENHQYYLRNGASGTPSMLAAMVADPAKWRSRNSTVFPPIGTAFRILSPPVVLFDESISTGKEGDPIVLNVAIYEHDGSRLTVDAVFNTFNSIADTNDIKKNRTHTFNFTGLIGNAVYAVEIPTEDDDNYEGTENAFFELQNLSKGTFGDFVSHVAFIQDNELPSVQITDISYSGEPDSDYIEIQNNESVDVDFSGWKLVSRNVIQEFNYGTIIPAFQALKIIHPNAKNSDNEGQWLTRASGTLELKTDKDEVVSNLRYRKTVAEEEIVTKRELSSSELSNQSISVPQISQSLTGEVNKVSKEETSKKAGWYVVKQDMLNEATVNQESYIWNEQTRTFDLFDAFGEESTIEKPHITYLEADQINKSEAVADSVEIEISDFSEEELKLRLTATDADENGVINGAEGFNFLRNTTNKPIVVKDLLNALNSKLFEGAIYPFVYLWKEDGQAWMTSSKLSGFDQIPAESSFWIRADSVFEPIELTFTVSPYLDSETPVEEIRKSNSGIGIKIQTEVFRKDISINFFEGLEELPRNILAPELEPELRVNNNEYLFFGAGTGLNWNSEINLALNEDQKMVFPLAFETSESGTFGLSISSWENIPADWKIVIEDLELDKEYEVNQNWTFEFDYFKADKETQNQEALAPTSNETEEVELHRFNLVIIPPGVAEAQSSIPEEVSLGQNYPNPFNPTTTISFYLPEAVHVKLAVFNVVGQPVAELTEGTLSPGNHEFEWDATGLPSGMYIYQLEVGNKIMTRKMTLVK